MVFIASGGVRFAEPVPEPLQLTFCIQPVLVRIRDLQYGKWLHELSDQNLQLLRCGDGQLIMSVAASHTKLS